MSKFVVWVEGLIGSGKSTLAVKIAQELNFRLLSEPVDSNPYLSDFYKDPKKWAFTMQIELLARRFAMQKVAAYEAVSPDSLFAGCVLDRGLPGDRVFAKMHTSAGNIDYRQWKTYEQFYDIMACSITPPSHLIFLDVEPEVAHRRVVRRDRLAENGLPLSYLQDLRNGYEDLLKEIQSGEHAWSRGMKIHRINWNEDNQSIQGILDIFRK